MTIYDMIVQYLFENGPIVSFFRFCLDQNISYHYGWEQARRAEQKKHIRIIRCTNTKSHPNRLELTPRGALYLRGSRGGAA